MTPDERTLLNRYLTDLTQTRNVAKDPEAAGLINQALTANPDAFYLLVQHAIIADHSLQLAQERIHALEARLAAQERPPQAQASSFLGGAMESGPWGQNQTQQPSAAPPSPVPQAMPYAAPSAFPPVQSQPSGFSSFLRNMGTTAAGVVAGQALSSGVESLFGGRGGFGSAGLFGGPAGFGGLGGGQSAFGGGETVIVNNYSMDDDSAGTDYNDDSSDYSSYNDDTV